MPSARPFCPLGRAARLLAAGAIAGCGFHAVSDKGDLGAGDLAGHGSVADLWGAGLGADLTGGGGGAGGGADLARTQTCPAPVLLVGVENVSGSANGGRIARVSLAGPMPTQCATLSAQGLIGAQPLAVTASGSYVAAATLDGIYLVDASSDTMVWNKPNGDTTGTIGPMDAFMLAGPGGASYFAVAYGRFGDNPPSITALEAYDASGAAAAQSPWCVQGAGCTTLPLSLQTTSFAANAMTPSHLLASDMTNNMAAWDIDPFAQTRTQLIADNGAWLSSLYSVEVGGALRLAFTNTPSSGAPSIDFVDAAQSGATLDGPLRCASNCATILHVVPDPTSATGFVALCAGATIDTRTVVRVDRSGTCVPLLAGAQFGTSSRLSHLGLAL